MNEKLVPLEPLVVGDERLGCGCKTLLVVQRGIQVGGFEPAHRGGARFVSSVATEYAPCDEHLPLVPVVRERYAAKRVRKDELFPALVKVVQEVVSGR